MAENIDLGALFGAPDDVTTFLGLEACASLEELAAPVALIGAPCATPYGSVGAYCRNAPQVLRQAAATLAANIDRHNFDLGGPVFPVDTQRAVDCGDLPYDENDAPGNRATIRKAIGKIVAANAVPVVIGGDDSIPIPMLQALAGSGPYTILQIDAHIDWRQSHMGEDMGLSSTMRRASEMDHIEAIVQVGARGLGSGHTRDYHAALHWGAQFVTAYDLHVDGPSSALARIPYGAEIIVCLDVDALDPAIVPGVIGRTPGGLSYFQVLDLLKGAAARGRIAAVDFVEYMPEADVDNIGALTVSRLIIATLGLLARQADR